ncbi:MAG: hypothetical protein IPK26_22150 [Planctomycetes bacterium]|nr:hypothetical protein [Planctomycetota bacterium]
MLRLVIAFVLGTALNAQVPLDHLVVCNRTTTGGTPGLLIVDPNTGVTTPFRLTATGSVAATYRSIAFDATAPNVLYTTSVLATAVQATLWPLTLNGNQGVRSTLAVNINGGQPWRLRSAGPLGLAILSRGNTGNRMFLRDMATGNVTAQPTASLLPAQPSDLLVLGGRLYASSEGDGSPTAVGTIVEWDPVANTDRLVGNGHPPITALASLGGVLLAGDRVGDLHLIDPVTGMRTLFLSTTLGRIASIAIDRGGRVFLATNPGVGSNVYDLGNLVQPLWTTPALIEDLKASPANVATMLTFGSGCVGSNGAAPQLGHTGMPALGSSFAVSLANAPMVGGALLVLGNSRANDGGNPLPRDLGGFGLPGCLQYTNALATVFAAVSGGSAALSITVPANPALAGVQVPMQWLVIDQTANPAGATTSSGGEAHLR